MTDHGVNGAGAPARRRTARTTDPVIDGQAVRRGLRQVARMREAAADHEADHLAGAEDELHEPRPLGSKP